ncbi:hypothetical protein B0H12DRAFT_131581 [Mycena haematopus]|nr:hypothetical protein B0H12DRAFT_131581 [Mycena haematopus]
MAYRCPNCGFMKSRSTDDTPYALPPHLLATNDPPTDVEVAEIHDAVDHLNTSVVDLDASITEVEHLLEKLRIRRQHAIENIRRGGAILSVKRRLPSDILGEIFSYTVPDYVPHDRRATDYSPWVYGRVCSRWRTLTLSLPTLWSHIDTKIPLALLTAQLRLSKGCGLTIHTFYSDIEALHSLVDCSDRWEVVNIQMGVKTLATLDRVHGKVPMLRELRCSDCTSVGSCTAFQIAPNLSSVNITGTASLQLPWAQLTKLRQEIPEVDGLSQLGSARNLVELSLTHWVEPSLALARTNGLSELLEFPHLRLLYIDDGEFLDFLVLPALEDIHIARHTQPLASLIDRSLCRLRKLTTYIDMNFDIIPVLERAPTLLKIEIYKDPDLERLLSYLTIPPDSDIDFRPPCPELHTLLYYYDLNEHQSILLAQMIESRLRSSACSNLSWTI